MKDTACQIPLSQGKVAIVSPEDYEFLSQFIWHARKVKTSYGFLWYARASRGYGKCIHMHRLVAERMGLKCKRFDHRDRNGINNTRENIRPASQSENCANKTKQSGTISAYKGIDWVKPHKRWRARIMIRGKRIYLGEFIDEIEAHAAYAVASVRFFGEFACP